MMELNEVWSSTCAGRFLLGAPLRAALAQSHSPFSPPIHQRRPCRPRGLRCRIGRGHIPSAALPSHTTESTPLFAHALSSSPILHLSSSPTDKMSCSPRLRACDHSTIVYPENCDCVYITLIEPPNSRRNVIRSIFYWRSVVARMVEVDLEGFWVFFSRLQRLLHDGTSRLPCVAALVMKLAYI